MEQFTRAALLKRVILLFWCLWLGIVVTMNTGNLLVLAGAMPKEWGLSSDNYHAIVKQIDVYSLPHWVAALFLLGATVWELSALLLFAWATRRWRNGHPGRLR